MENQTISKREKAFHWLSFGTIALAFFILLRIIFMSFYPFRIMEVTNSPVPVVEKEIHPGDTIFHSIDYCKYRDLNATVHIQLINHISIPINNHESHISVGCKDNVRMPGVIIPIETPPGEYKLVFHNIYEITSYRKITYSYETETFTVLDTPSEEVVE